MKFLNHTTLLGVTFMLCHISSVSAISTGHDIALEASTTGKVLDAHAADSFATQQETKDDSGKQIGSQDQRIVKLPNHHDSYGLQPTTTSLQPPVLGHGIDKYLASLSMILVSEFGDKTFIIALLLSMKHSRLQVFTAAFSALAAMTVISAVLGKRIMSFLPQNIIGLAAGFLFLILGAQMFREGFQMSSNSGLDAEILDVETDLEAFNDPKSAADHFLDTQIEEKQTGSAPANNLQRMKAFCASSSSKIVAGAFNLLTFVCNPLWARTFTMTLLAEWGDRSQVSTMAMASGSDFSYVVYGAISGHLVCTGLAVLGGRSIAGKVSMKVVTLCGAASFICFGFVYVLQWSQTGVSKVIT